MKIIDHYLSQITMYRLVLYILIVFVSLGFLNFSPIFYLATIFLVLITSWLTNKIFSFVFKAPTNLESVYITALIIILIFSPIQNASDVPVLFWVLILSISSKYVLAINKKHIFNPVAIGAVLVSFGLRSSASWWIGNTLFMPFVLLGSLLIVRKLQKEVLFFAFLLTTFIVSGTIVIFSGGNLLTLLTQLLFHSSLLFFAGVMLTEPQTMPPKRSIQIIYATLTGFLFVPQVHLGSLIYSSPELALVIGNLVSYLLSPKEKFWLTLQQKIQTSPETFDFIFNKDLKFNFLPGQYMEFTLAHKKQDSRGTRRYFTLASSPTEKNIKIGVKFSPNGSSYKKFLLSLSQNIPIIASQISGNLTLPKDQKQKLVFIAGGIGITPFRSMIKFLLDQKQFRDIILIYSVKRPENILYKDIFDKSNTELNIQTIYTITDTTSVPQNWQGETGRVDENMITRKVPDYKERIFYLSGTHSMVTGLEQILRSLNISKNQIKKDFFPGL